MFPLPFSSYVELHVKCIMVRLGTTLQQQPQKSHKKPYIGCQPTCNQNKRNVGKERVVGLSPKSREDRLVTYLSSLELVV